MLPICDFNESFNFNFISDFVLQNVIMRKEFCVISNYTGDLTDLIKQLDYLPHAQLFNKVISNSDITERDCDILEINQEKVLKFKHKLINATSEIFHLHTDCVYYKKPINCLILYCVSNSKVGGENILLSVENLIHELTPSEIEYLEKPIFPFRHGLEPILVKDSKNKFMIRYNRHGINNAIDILQFSCPNEMSIMLDKLDRILLDSPSIIKYKLKPGDVLFVNNNYYLHGRLAFDENFPRVLKRLRFFFSEHYVI